MFLGKIKVRCCRWEVASAKKHTKWSPLSKKDPAFQAKVFCSYASNHTGVQTNENTKTRAKKTKEQMKAKSEDVSGGELPICLEPSSRKDSEQNKAPSLGKVAVAPALPAVEAAPARIKWGRGREVSFSNNWR